MLRAAAEALHAIRSHAAEAYPDECCGILLGTRSGDDSHLHEAIRCANRSSDSRRSYAIAPEDLIRTQREARARALEIVGFYHSHPDHPAEPSASDRAQAHWSGCFYVICSVMSGTIGDLRAYRLRDGALQRDEIAPFASDTANALSQDRAKCE